MVAKIKAGNLEIRAISYLPRDMPDGLKPDPNYEIRSTEGNDFSPLQPLQSWIDLLEQGIEPSRVKLRGMNGGKIAAFEYRLALVLGAEVGSTASIARPPAGRHSSTAAR